MNSNLNDLEILKNHFDYSKSKLFQPLLKLAMPVTMLPLTARSVKRVQEVLI